MNPADNHDKLKRNQSTFDSADIPGEASVSGATAESVFNSNIEETVLQHQRATGRAGVYGGKAKSKCLEMFLEGSN